MEQDVADLNCIIRYLARRDLPELTPEALLKHLGVARSDLLILMGGITTTDFAEMAANAYHSGLATRLFVVGGCGHSTQNLRDNVARHPSYRTISTSDRTEADILCDIMVEFLGVERGAILLERQSTNCGSNASLALDILVQAGIARESAVIIQDPIMQRRTIESFRDRWRRENTRLVAFAPVIPLLAVRAGAVEFADPRHEGYYRMEDLLRLVMGEIPRLRDDENGYGPRGSAFIGHVSIPQEVSGAFDRLMPRYSQHVRPRIKHFHQAKS